MSKTTKPVRVLVTQTVSECLDTIVMVPEGADETDIANCAVAEALDREHGWCVTDNPWSVRVREGGTVSEPLSPDFEAVEAIRSEERAATSGLSEGEGQALAEAARALVAGAPDWDGESPFVDVAKDDFDALAAVIIRAQGRAER